MLGMIGQEQGGLHDSTTEWYPVYTRLRKR